jgi:hypothetical protein
MTSPKYTHDCTNCKFLGNTIGGGQIHDLYLCSRGPELHEQTLVARYSDDGPGYKSITRNAVRPGGHAELWAAESMANEKHLQKARQLLRRVCSENTRVSGTLADEIRQFMGYK